MPDLANDPGATFVDSCDPRRTAEAVMDAHFAAVRSADLARITADYAPDAVLMLPGKVADGREQIAEAFAGLLASAGAVHGIEVTSTTVHGGNVLLTYSVDSEHMVIADGVDTFAIVDGRIQLQTAHFGGLSTR